MQQKALYATECLICNRALSLSLFLPLFLSLFLSTTIDLSLFLSTKRRALSHMSRSHVADENESSRVYWRAYPHITNSHYWRARYAMLRLWRGYLIRECILNESKKAFWMRVRHYLYIGNVVPPYHGLTLPIFVYIFRDTTRYGCGGIIREVT